MDKLDETKIKSLYYYFCKESVCNNEDCVDCDKVKLHPAIVNLVEYKNKRFEQNMRNHEQKLLNTFKEIFAQIHLTTQEYDFAVSFFKLNMINKDLQ